MRYIILFLFICALPLSFISAQESSTLKVGMKAPDFTLPDAQGNEYTLSSYINKSPVVLYFYPAAGTSGCTKEACGIRDDWSKFKKDNIQVIGVSVDNKKAIEKFINDYHLNFPLLSDSGKKVSKEYGVLNKNGYDNRVTFIIDQKGKIAKVFPVTDIENHSKEVYEIASKLHEE